VFVYRGCGQSSHLYLCEVTTEKVLRISMSGGRNIEFHTHFVGGLGATFSRICMYMAIEVGPIKIPKLIWQTKVFLSLLK
jgi:hypothetical protein